MSLQKMPRDICISMALNLKLGEILRLSASCRPMHATSMHVADMSLDSELEGLEGVCFAEGLRMKKKTTPHRHLLWAALRPHIVLCGCTQNCSDMTVPFRFSLDTQGPLVLEFQIIVAKATNGTPKIGFVDADAVPPSFGQWAGDLSRGHAGSDTFAIGFCPSCGSLCATKAALQSQRITSEPLTMWFAGAMRSSEHYAARLKWKMIGDHTRKWNAPIRAALAVENGKLTFFRLHGGVWHSSGVLLDNLPRKVMPCIFMSSFIGYVKVNFDRMSSNTPKIHCPGCDALGHGVVNGWRRILFD